MFHTKLKFIIQRIKNILHLFEAIVANIYYQFPSKKLKVIGITGTDGKTTTTHLIYHILKSAGKKVSMISTVYAKIGEESIDTGLHTTTPGVFFLQKLLKKSIENGDEYFILETTSHALDQNRVWGIKFAVGLITNITHEHLDYHKSYQNYLKTKVTLLKKAEARFVNTEDESYRFIKNYKLKIEGYNQKLKILKAVGNLTKFNRQNYAAAYSVCHYLGLTDRQIIEAMKSFKLPPGRMELVYNGLFKVIIDFAHTPNAFRQVLPEVISKYLKKRGRLIHVFGAAGLRDDSKRPLMGEVSAYYSDVVILTEEDYRTENLYKICKQIASGILKKKFKFIDKNLLSGDAKKIYTIIPNRDEAIRKAIDIAQKNDVVIITGKAHEKSLCRGKIEYRWDEFATVLKYVNLRSKT